jgi:uncharacterized membrane protein
VPEEEPDVTNGVLTRLDDLERRLDGLGQELRQLRAEVSEAPAAPAPAPAPTPTRPPPSPAATQRAWAPPTEPSKRREPRFWDRELELPKVELADVLGARALAWAGGIVTLLGVLFFFVLAVNRGWIGPVERVSLGALASLLLLTSGLLVRRRYGQLYSAVSAVGAGIASGYATLLAAAALYELVPDLAALAIAAGIAAVGTAISLAWRSETVASIGLVGATLVPVSAVFDGGISALGTAFAGVMLAATAVVAIHRRWDVLLVAGAAAALPQIAWLVHRAGEGADGPVLVTAVFFWLLVLSIGLARHADRGDRPDSLSTGFVLTSALLAGTAARALLNGELAGIDKEGAALLAVAVTYVGLAAAWFRRDRDMSALLGALGLAVGAVAAAALLGGATLAVAWAAQAAVLAWLAHRIVEPRYGIASLAYLALAIVHTLGLDAPPRELFVAAAHPAADAPVAAAVGLAAIVVAFYARLWRLHRPARGELDRIVEGFVSRGPEIALTALLTGATLLVHAASLALLEAGVAAGSFDWSEVAVTAFWGIVGAGWLIASRRWPHGELYGLAWAAAALIKLVLYDAPRLDADQTGVAALALAGSLLAAAILGRAPVAVGLVPVAAVVAGGGALSLGTSSTAEGLGLLAVASPFGALAALRFGDRARSTALWASALGLGLTASALLLEHTALVASWAAAAVALAALAEWTRERRLQLGAYAFTALALGYSLLVLAPPAELLLKDAAPADGVPALLLALGALIGVTRRVWEAEPRDELDRRLAEAQSTLRPSAAVGAAVLSIYVGSLTLLELSQALGGDLTTAFQRGHTAVSTFWGAIGLAALYLGLKRGSASLRLAGFALFGLSLAKIFLYDLSMLSSVTRALSFLAVGAVLLLAGFFYQRLAVGAPEGNST